MNIQWKRGDFITFFAKMKIRVGGKDDIAIQKDDEFEYDGSICKYSGAEFATPSLRGAIRDDWATTESPYGDTQSSAPPAFAAPRAVAKSQTKNTDLSRVQRTQPMQMETDSLDEETVLQVSDRQALPRDARGRLDGHLTQADNRRTAGLQAPKNPNAGQRALKVTQSDIDQQDHTVVARVRSPANLGKINVIEHPGVARDLELRSADAGFGKAAGVRQAPHTVHREGVDIKMNVGRVDPNIQIGDESDGIPVGRVNHRSRNASAEGIEVTDTSNIREQRAAKAAPKPAAKPAPKPAAKPAPKAAAKPAKVENLSMKVKMARQFDPSFPADWDFTGKLAERLDRVRAHGAKVDFLKALYAAEGDQMRKVLEKEFPRQLAS